MGRWNASASGLSSFFSVHSPDLLSSYPLQPFFLCQHSSSTGSTRRRGSWRWSSGSSWPWYLLRRRGGSWFQRGSNRRRHISLKVLLAFESASSSVDPGLAEAGVPPVGVGSSEGSSTVMSEGGCLLMVLGTSGGSGLGVPGPRSPCITPTPGVAGAGAKLSLSSSIAGRAS